MGFIGEGLGLRVSGVWVRVREFRLRVGVRGRVRG